MIASVRTPDAETFACMAGLRPPETRPLPFFRFFDLFRDFVVISLLLLFAVVRRWNSLRAKDHVCNFFL